jgi:molybdopterin synthase catalytic subunit
MLLFKRRAFPPERAGDDIGFAVAIDVADTRTFGIEVTVELLALPGDLGGGVKAGSREGENEQTFHDWWTQTLSESGADGQLLCAIDHRAVYSARMPPVFILNEEPIQPATTVFKSGEGAEAQFLGVVRGMEDGQTISGIDYSAYLPMAEKMLRELVERGEREHGPHRVFIQHRLGFVAAEQPSILIKVRTKHSI